MSARLQSAVLAIAAALLAACAEPANQDAAQTGATKSNSAPASASTTPLTRQVSDANLAWGPCPESSQPGAKSVCSTAIRPNPMQMCFCAFLPVMKYRPTATPRPNAWSSSKANSRCNTKARSAKRSPRANTLMVQQGLPTARPVSLRGLARSLSPSKVRWTRPQLTRSTNVCLWRSAGWLTSGIEARRAETR